MVKNEVRDLFIRKGFELREVKSPDYTVAERNGEVVACIYDDSVYVTQNYPSLNSNGYRSYAGTPKTNILFTSPMKELEDAIEFLLDSPRRIDEQLRDVKLSNVRKYFNKKKEEAESLERALQKVPGWREYEAKSR